MQYLTILKKADFTDLYKYGSFYVRKVFVFDGEIENNWNNTKLFDDLTSELNGFEYSFEYLLIHFASEEQSERANLVNIRDILAVYAFDEEAKREVSITFDSRINIKVSPWAFKFGELKQHMLKEQHLKGTKLVQELFRISDEEFDKCQSIIDETVVSEVFRELFANEHPCGDKSIWVYLLRYERHNYYLKDMRGYFLDCVHTILDLISKGENKNLDAEKMSDVGRELVSHDSSKLGFCDLVAVINTQRFVDSIEPFQPRCRYQVVAPLFLHLKDKFKGGLTLAGIDYILSYKQFGFDYSLAVYLLGLTLGYEKIYSCYYDSIKLPIFKETKTDEIPTSDKAEENEPVSTEQMSIVGQGQPTSQVELTNTFEFGDSLTADTLTAVETDKNLVVGEDKKVGEYPKEPTLFGDSLSQTVSIEKGQGKGKPKLRKDIPESEYRNFEKEGWKKSKKQ